MALVEPDKKDPYGLAGRDRGRSPFLGPRIRRIKAKPIIPPAVKNAVIDFGIDIWYDKKTAEAKKRARRSR